MEKAVQITHRHLDPSDEIIAYIDREARKLKSLHHQVISCHVTLEKPHRRHHKGNPVRVRAVVQVPGKQLVASKEPSESGSPTADLLMAANGVFQVLTRALRSKQGRRPSAAAASRRTQAPRYWGQRL
jgi:ribosome-associated translation inhibitor RaiA